MPLFFATSMAVETTFLTYKAKKILQFPPKSKNKGSKNYLKPHLRLNAMFVSQTIKTWNLNKKINLHRFFFCNRQARN